MPDVPDLPRPGDDAAVVTPPEELAAGVVVRAVPNVPRRRPVDRLAAMRRRLPELLQDPAVAATAALTVAVAGEVAIGVVRRVLGAGISASGPTTVSGTIEHRVHVVHHHVVHLIDARALPRG